MSKLSSAGYAVVLSMMLAGCAQEPGQGEAEDDVGELEQEALAGSLTISPTSYSFGSILVGASSTNLGLTVRNRGLSRTQPLSVSLSGSGASHFVIVSNACAGARLAAGATCSVVVRFAPTAAGVRSATLTASASGSGSAAAILSGTGLGAAALAITPASYSYGNVAVGSSVVASFTVSNSGGAPSGMLTRGISDAARFPVFSDSCTGTVLAAGASCTIAVAFAPTDAGARSATLTVSASPGGTVAATLAGVGVVPAQLVISATTHDYGAVFVGDNMSYTFVVSNTGTLASGMLSAAVSDAADFPLLSDSCSGLTLAAGATCTITVAFAPTSAGAHSATLTVSASPGGTTAAALTGFGTAPAQLVISATAHDYGAVSVGSSMGYTFVVSNVGSLPSGLITSAVSDAANFPIFSDSCVGATLAAGATCTVTVSFRPTSPGPRSATLTVSGLPGGTSTAALAGTGI